MGPWGKCIAFKLHVKCMAVQLTNKTLPCGNLHKVESSYYKSCITQNVVWRNVIGRNIHWFIDHILIGLNNAKRWWYFKTLLVLFKSLILQTKLISQIGAFFRKFGVANLKQRIETHHHWLLKVYSIILVFKPQLAVANVPTLLRHVQLADCWVHCA